MTATMPSTRSTTASPAAVHLAAGGVSVVIDPAPVPAIVFWGPRIPDDEATMRALLATAAPAVTNSSFDAPRRVSVLPGSHDGWSGAPAIEWHAAGGRTDGWDLVGIDPVGDAAVRVILDAEGGALRLTLDYALEPSGLLRCTAEVANTGARTVELAALRIGIPLPRRASEVLDFTGRWIGERREQRQAVRDGVWTRAARRGRPGHDAVFVTAVGTPGFANGAGEVWAMHVGWSGDPEHLVERLPEGVGTDAVLLSGGETLAAGEIQLAPGESYRSPAIAFAHSTHGLDGIRRVFHEAVRGGDAYPHAPRPLVLNTWEAVYFDHRPEVLADLAERAAAIGVERFVLDDGWYSGRHDDTRALGDWYADADVWHDGLGPLAEHVHALGMGFGLWVEPEMVSLNSELARAHPDWVLDGITDRGSWRHQFVLDLTVPGAFDHVLARLDEAVGQWGVDFLKWDHNRELTATRATGRTHSVHEQTLRFYELLGELRSRHPRLEIESCASGGGRIDLGVLELVQRVWPSDTNDPVERIGIQRGTSLLVPPELIGTHVGPAEAHTTHRPTSLGFRLLVALFGHAGIEWDISACTEVELARLREWTALYRELRPLLHSGVTSYADGLEPGETLMTVADAARRHAVTAYTRTDAGAVAATPRLRIPGLDPERVYAVRVRTELGLPEFQEVDAPAWLPLDGTAVDVPGRVLGSIGVPLPRLNPASGILLELTAAD